MKIRSHTPPVFQTATFSFESLEEAAETFEGKKPGFIYSRLDNPNFRSVEEAIAPLEGGQEALVFSSGMAAVSAVLFWTAGAGAHVISTQTVYGCSNELFSDLLPKFGIEVSFVDTRDPENVRKAIKEDTRLIFLETPTNPTMDLADIAEISKIARQHQILVAVDNTFATPYNQRPLLLGADLVIHSLTKYLNGHGDVIMGVVAGGHSLREGENSLSRWRTLTGAVPSPHDCALVYRGLKTFGLRMERHNGNALALAGFFERHPMVSKVYYPGLEDHPQHDLARKQMVTKSGKPGFGGMISLELKGGEAAARKFLDFITKNSSIALAVSLGHTETLVEVPAQMTHARIAEEKRLEKGITDGLIRVSVGIEDYADLEKAFSEALNSLG